MAEEENKISEKKEFIIHSGPIFGMKYPLNVVYCPPDSKFDF